MQAEEEEQEKNLFKVGVGGLACAAVAVWRHTVRGACAATYKKEKELPRCRRSAQYIA